MERGVELDGGNFLVDLVEIPTHPPELVIDKPVDQVTRKIYDAQSRCLEVQNFPKDKNEPHQLRFDSNAMQYGASRVDQLPRKRDVGSSLHEHASSTVCN